MNRTRRASRKRQTRSKRQTRKQRGGVNAAYTNFKNSVSKELSNLRRNPNLQRRFQRIIEGNPNNGKIE